MDSSNASSCRVGIITYQWIHCKYCVEWRRTQQGYSVSLMTQHTFPHVAIVRHSPECWLSWCIPYVMLEWLVSPQEGSMLDINWPWDEVWNHLVFRHTGELQSACWSKLHLHLEGRSDTTAPLGNCHSVAMANKRAEKNQHSYGNLVCCAQTFKCRKFSTKHHSYHVWNPSLMHCRPPSLFHLIFKLTIYRLCVILCSDRAHVNTYHLCRCGIPC